MNEQGLIGGLEQVGSETEVEEMVSDTQWDHSEKVANTEVLAKQEEEKVLQRKIYLVKKKQELLESQRQIEILNHKLDKLKEKEAIAANKHKEFKTIIESKHAKVRNWLESEVFSTMKDEGKEKGPAGRRKVKDKEVVHRSRTRSKSKEVCKKSRTQSKPKDVGRKGNKEEKMTRKAKTKANFLYSIVKTPGGQMAGKHRRARSASMEHNCIDAKRCERDNDHNSITWHGMGHESREANDNKQHNSAMQSCDYNRSDINRDIRDIVTEARLNPLATQFKFSTSLSHGHGACGDIGPDDKSKEELISKSAFCDSESEVEMSHRSQKRGKESDEEGSKDGSRRTNKETRSCASSRASTVTSSRASTFYGRESDSDSDSVDNYFGKSRSKTTGSTNFYINNKKNSKSKLKSGMYDKPIDNIVRKVKWAHHNLDYTYRSKTIEYKQFIYYQYVAGESKLVALAQEIEQQGRL